MRPDCIRFTGFIRRHCGSVTVEAPSGRAIGAQRQFCRRSFLKGVEPDSISFTLPGKHPRQGRACSGSF